jgi:hypothetical protein
MAAADKIVDGFRFMPPSLKAWISRDIPAEEFRGDIPWTPLQKPVREIPKTATEAEIEVNHLHINTDYIRQDINVMLPLARFREFKNEGIIGRLAPTCYSYYGFQLDPKVLLDETMSKVAAKMKQERVEAVLLTSA